MRPSSHTFAELLAARIGQVLPPPLAIRASAGRLEVHARDELLGGSAAAEIVDAEDGRTAGERIETAARAILGGIQDVVSEYLTLPWPRDPEGGMAAEGARSDDRRLYLWYGSHELDPVIALEPIALDELV